MAYRTAVETARNGRKVYKLLDDASGASASILPSFGFNLFELKLPAAGAPRSVIETVPDFVENPRDPARNGTPVLFPYPNRVREGKFSFQGKAYQLPVTLGQNAIHGFAMDAAWDVVDHGVGAEGAFITGRYHMAKHSPAGRETWPSDALLHIKYTLSGRRLEMSIRVGNPTDSDLPYGFGIHPYFRLPFGPGGDQSKTQVILPASKYWVLEEFLPTGKTEPVTDRLDFRKGQPIKGLKLDDVLTGLMPDGDSYVCRLRDVELNAEFRLSFDRKFRELVVYTPPGAGNVISLEPYTQTTDAINLHAKRIDGGLKVLPHGKEDAFRISFETVG